MTESPPIPAKKKHRRLVICLITGAAIVFIITIISLVLVIRFLSQYGLTEPMDRMFGDQKLKSAVAMVELHKIRFGKYPDSLKDLKYTGQWDQMWLSSTKYYPSENRLSYYIEVEHGWIGKPTLIMPDGFWNNTGYDESLKPKEEQ